MTLPFVLPPWLPWWVPMALLIPALLYALALLVMPFSVIGVKGRLEALDARLDDLQDEVRRLALRLPEPPGRRGFEDIGYTPPVLPAAERPAGSPLASAAVAPLVPTRSGADSRVVEHDPRRREAERVASRPMRTEPRLDRLR
jgi:hypothetical protein